MVEWKQIPLFPLFEASNHGRIRGYQGGEEVPSFVLEGRNVVTMTSIPTESISFSVSVANLVAAAFMPRYHPGMLIVHKNGNTLDDSIENLEAR